MTIVYAAVSQIAGRYTNDSNRLVVLGSLIAAAVVVFYVQKALALGRTRALRARVDAMGFTFVGEDGTSLDQPPVMRAPLFAKGHSGKWSNVMAGSRSGLRVNIFDYRYTVGNGKGSSTYAQTVAAFSKDGVCLPTFEMWPGGTFDEIREALTHKNIQFDSNPEFSKRFELRSVEESRLRALFTPDLLRFMERLDAEAKWEVEGAGDTLLVYRPGDRTAPEQLGSFLDETSAIASHFLA